MGSRIDLDFEFKYFKKGKTNKQKTRRRPYTVQIQTVHKSMNLEWKWKQLNDQGL